MGREETVIYDTNGLTPLPQTKLVGFELCGKKLRFMTKIFVVVKLFDRVEACAEKTGEAGDANRKSDSLHAGLVIY